ncbi:antizyme inhibitor 2 isoform X1 [Chelonia mydas]|uniref:antizyme inhibitor 2 isoform X1 n=4 Tax=Chelonia mydas TaxID=8469 RepID=UPI0018A1E92F|nr:antizyme inhibitor 2 isoform X1 [Chelonia mydas]XP_043388112.1 antizyme inhibitor 2 isoform X1 [Chelonia mydas]XP_043388113.1 antizyme inhibitor 2 isoform X1 [Chelonia mydas]
MSGYLDESDFMMVEEGFTTRDLLENLLMEVSQTSDKGAFFVADLGDIVKKHLHFLKALPHVKPFYAVKCNSSKGVVRTLAELGAGFDCASKTEIALVQSIGVPPDKIIYTNPCKQISQIKYAASHGVQLMAFDNEVELGKVARSHPHARMVLCIATDSPRSSACLSVKFGATLKSCRHLLETAKEMNVEIVGVSFHVGSDCPDLQAFTRSIADARLVFEMGAELGYKMHLLDIGGGFPGTENSKVRFEEMAATINSALDLYFPEGCGVEIIAKPGRYYVASAFTLAVNVVDKQEVPLDPPGSDDEEPGSKKSILYYINDGIYGSFSCIFFNRTCPSPILHKKHGPDHPLFSSSLWGPSCDGQDCIADGLELPELQVGDWLTFENMGAYTIAASSSFNGHQQPQINYAMSREAVRLLQGKQPQPEEEDRESLCAPLSCGWEITDTLCITPVFTPARIT